MEVHAHSHTARKKWTHYLWEFLMLFLAVFCGFIAENLREHAVEKKRAKEYARSLVLDLQQDTAMINEIMTSIQMNKRNIDTLASIIEGKSINELNNLDLTIISANVGRYPPFSWNRTTIDQIKNSGSLRYFSNESIVAKISVYDAFTKHLDGDFISDENRIEAISEKRAQVLDLNYPLEFRMKLFYGATLFSLRNTAEYKQAASLNRTVLTRDISQFKIFLNLTLIQQPNFHIRGDIELPEIIKDAEELIQMIEKEYNLK